MISKWLYRLTRPIYGLKKQEFSKCDFVVPLSYGLINEKKLPKISKKLLQEAAETALKYHAQIAWSSVDYFWDGDTEQENALKLEQIRNTGFMDNPIITEKGCNNTITEMQNVRQAIINNNGTLENKTIVFVADWLHARSVLKIGKHIFPEATVVIKSLNDEWNEPDHPSFLLRSKLRWFSVNLIRHLALMVLGFKIVGLIKQPINKKRA
ncbi:hypothetical protein IID20_02735 [Patescibacteria group bacterium]|nr:hypothetical protein [Patescibacteria group bacterium]